jgi:hypothetical protein
MNQVRERLWVYEFITKMNKNVLLNLFTHSIYALFLNSIHNSQTRRKYKIRGKLK